MFKIIFSKISIYTIYIYIAGVYNWGLGPAPPYNNEWQCSSDKSTWYWELYSTL